MSELDSKPMMRPIALKNVNCAYCGHDFSDELPSTREHVIGRRFVPKGSLAVQWNLILNACRDCNNKKSHLEGDISVITMLPTHVGREAATETVLSKEIARKAAKAISERTKKPVSKSQEAIQLEFERGAAKISTEFFAPPQIDDSRVYKLAQFHFTAFFFLITYNESTRRGGFVLGDYMHFGFFRRENWGAVDALWFLQLTESWEHRCAGDGADGFFRIHIRKCPGANVWSFAVEWNQSHRVLAFAGDPQEIQRLLESVPNAVSTWVRLRDGNLVRLTESISLDPSIDTLFAQIEAAPASADW